MRILTYNVRYFGHRSGGLASQDKTIRDIARTIARLPAGAPEIICFQEIETRSMRADLHRSYNGPESDHRAAQFRRLFEYFKPGRPDLKDTQLRRFDEFFSQELQAAGSRSNYQHYYFPAHTYRLAKDHNLYTTGLAILVKQPLVVLEHNADGPCDITHRRLKTLARWKQTRICAHAKVASPDGQLLDIYNTHLSLPAFFSRSLLKYSSQLGFGLNQLEEVKRLIQFVKSTASPNAGMILLGDFNSLPGSPVHLALTRDCGLFDPLARLRENGHSSKARFPTAGVMGLRLPIDYMFCNSALRWQRFEDTRPFGDHEGLFHGLSDHIPLLGRFENNSKPLNY